MDFSVKNLPNFVLTAKGLFNKAFWVRLGKTEAEAEKRFNAREVEFTIQNGLLIQQRELGAVGDHYYPFNPNYKWDAPTLRNFADIAVQLADAIEEELVANKKVAP